MYKDVLFCEYVNRLFILVDFVERKRKYCFIFDRRVRRRLYINRDLNLLDLYPIFFRRRKRSKRKCLRKEIGVSTRFILRDIDP